MSRKGIASLLCCCLGMVGVQTSFADEPVAGKSGGCSGQAKAELASDDAKPASGCSAKAASKACGDRKDTYAFLPAVTYRVADFETACSKTADAKSREALTPVKYVVDGTVFDSCEAATVKLTSLLEGSIPSLTAVTVTCDGQTVGCPYAAQSMADSGKKLNYSVAGLSFASRQDAEAALANVKLAMSKNETTTPRDVQPSADSAAADSNKPGCCMSAVKAAGTSSEPRVGVPAKCGTMGTKKSCGSSDVTMAKAETEVRYGVCCDLNSAELPNCCPEVARLAEVRATIRSIMEAAATATTPPVAS